MQSTKLKSPQLPPEFYSDDLLIIKGVKFTPRQIDIIACLISGGTGKTISSLLDIEVKTLEAHKKSIGEKIGGGIQEDIIAFVQRSDKYELLKQHYLTLLYKNEFEKHLKELDKKFPENSTIFKIESQQISNKSSLLSLLIDHLKLARIKVVSDDKEIAIGKQSFHTLTILSKDTDQENLEQKIFILLDKGINPSTLEEICGDSSNYIDFREAKNYFSSCTEVFKKVYSDIDLEKLTLLTNPENNFILNNYKIDPVSSLTKKTPLFPRLNTFQKQKKWILRGGFIFLSAIVISLLTHIYQTNTLLAEKKIHEIHSIRSELQIPVDKILLKRPELIEKMNKQLIANDGLQTIALIGPGGAGKTILARQYAYSQNIPVVWEINAETKSTLLVSFEKLAHAITTSEIEKQKLKEVLDIKDLEEKQNALFSFIKEKLKTFSSWLLIYDNVSKFNDIHKCFPYKSDFWKNGKVIITTTDSNFRDNNFISSVMDVKELSPNEKLELFTKIISKPLIVDQQEKIKNFLENIPPFPLDISIAAYYIKGTNSSYEDYLQNVNSLQDDFENLQTNLLNEKTSYKKTRCAIIILSLNYLITTSKNFNEPLLLISLLDSQNIPIDILTNHKNRTVVDAFLYYLKKFSLITNESIIDSRQTFSIHRYTQDVILAYLTKTFSLTTYKQYLNQISYILENYINRAIDEDDFSKMKILIPHYEKFLSHKNLLPNNIIYSLSGELGGMYFYLGYYSRAKKLLENNIIELNKTINRNPISLAKTNGYLANVYRDLGNFEKTKELLENSLKVYQKYAPQSHTKLAWILAHLALVNREMGNYEKSKNLLEQSLDLYKKHLPSDHNRIRWALSLLGIVHRELGNYEKSKDFLEESLEQYLKAFPNNQVRIYVIMAHLGAVYRELGNYQKAEELIKKSLKIYKKYFSEYHIEVIRALRFLGDVYRDQNNYEEAKNLYEKNLDICKKYHSQDHLDIAYTLISFAQLYLRKGELDAAEKSLNIALNILQKKKHLELYRCFEKLGELFHMKSQKALKEGNIELSKNLEKRGKDYFIQAKKIVENNFSFGSPHILRIENRLKHLSNIA